MANNFPTGKLGDAAKVRSGYAFRSADLGTTGHRVVKIANIRPPQVDLSDCERIPVEILDSIRNVDRFRLHDGDTLIAMTGATVGKVGRFRDHGDPCYLNQRVGKVYLQSPELADYRYLYFVISSSAYVGQIFDAAGGSAQANVSGAQIESIQIPIPSLDEQRAITQVLGQLEDKIELNRRMNETLEATARAIFRSWFVDFDPVAAKAEGRPPAHMSPDTAALFPDHFDGSSLGPIPATWNPGTLTSFADVLNGGTPRTSIPEYWGGDIPWFSVIDAPAEGDIFVIQTNKAVTHEGVENSATRIVERGTTIISARGTVGRLALVGTSMAFNQSCYALVPKSPAGPSLLYFVARDSVEVLQQRTHGTVFDTITRDTLNNLEVIVPPDPVCLAFEDVVAPLLARVLANLKESGTLAAIRDALLPKLLSGEIRLREIERAVEAAI